VRVQMEDTPGALAGLLRDIAALGGNVIDVVHRRTDLNLAFDEVSIEVSVETKGPDHCTSLVGRLLDAGYRLTD